MLLREFSPPSDSVCVYAAKGMYRDYTFIPGTWMCLYSKFILPMMTYFLYYNILLLHVSPNLQFSLPCSNFAACIHCIICHHGHTSSMSTRISLQYRDMYLNSNLQFQALTENNCYEEICPLNDYADSA